MIAPDNETWMLRVGSDPGEGRKLHGCSWIPHHCPSGVVGGWFRTLPVPLLKEQPDAESRLCTGEDLQPAAQETAAPPPPWGLSVSISYVFPSQIM